jgi:hypothetical protein
MPFCAKAVQGIEVHMRAADTKLAIDFLMDLMAL